MSKISNEDDDDDKCLDTRGCDKPGIFAKHQSRFAKVFRKIASLSLWQELCPKLIIQELVVVTSKWGDFSDFGGNFSIRYLQQNDHI